MIENTLSRPKNWREAFASFFSKTGLFLVVTFAAFLLLDQVTTELIQDELMSPTGTTNWVWVYGGLSFAGSLLGPIAVGFMAICDWRFPGESPFSVARQHFGYLVKEEMRALGKSMLWGLLFLLPGAIRFFQLIFVSYVVLLDPSYQKGEVDALQRSWLFVRRVWIRLLFLFIFFGLIVPIGMTAFDEWRSFYRRPGFAFLFLWVDLTVLVVFQWLVLKTWEKAHETDVHLV